jgi:tetratricopeptide (TPR) repeat protein
MQALEDARDLLTTLNPKHSTDSETLGLWAAIHKRLWNATGNRKFLDESVRGYERGFYMLNDYYNGINLAYMLNVRASERVDPAEAITDFVSARRARQQVIAVCQQWLASAAPADVARDDDAPREKALKSKLLDTRYWVLATLGEAYVGLEKEEEAVPWLEQAYAMAPKSWMKQSTEEQLGKLRGLLKDSPLKRIA